MENDMIGFQFLTQARYDSTLGESWGCMCPFFMGSGSVFLIASILQRLSLTADKPKPHRDFLHDSTRDFPAAGLVSQIYELQWDMRR